MRRWLMVAAGSLLLLPGAALGATATTPTETGPVGQPSSSVSIDGGLGWGALRLLLGLAVVIAVIAGIAWFMRRRQGIAPHVRGALPGLEMIGTVPLAPNRAIYALRMADEVVLVAVTEGAATVIGRRSGEEAAGIIGRPLISSTDPLARQIEASLDAARTADGSFAAKLRKFTVRP